MRHNRGLPEGSEPFRASTPKPKPVSWRKVDSLCTVEAHVEAPVVRIGESDHKLPLMLSSAVHRDIVSVQDPG